MLKPYLVSGQPKWLKICLYSEPGAGKTWLASTAQAHPGMKDVLFIDIEGGLVTVSGVEGLVGVDPCKDENGNPRMDGDSLANLVDSVEQIYWDIIARKPGYENVNTVVLDSGTELQNLSLQQLVEANKEANKGGHRDSIDEYFQSDYGVNTNRVMRLLRLFRSAPFHFIMTALVKEERGKPVGKPPVAPVIGIGPDFTAKLGRAARGYMDFVWYLYADAKGERHLLTDKRGITYGKTRGFEFSTALGIKVTEPNLTDIYNLYLEVQKEGARK